MIVTIDGPAASGKSSVARCLAQKLDYYYLYSGLLYRACAYVLAEYGGYTKTSFIDLRKEDVTALCNPDRIVYTYAHQTGERILFDRTDITAHLKSAVIDDYASLISIDLYVRQAVKVLQESIGAEHNIIADGRDMGTVVFPHAQVKFFLTASVEARAKRWQQDQQKRGNIVTYEQAVAILTERDHRDTIRDHSPLAVAPDAIMIDNTNLSAAETCALMEKIVREHNELGQ